MTEIKLCRSGKRPLVFLGDKLAFSTTKGNNSTRWINVEVYKTSSGKIVVGIAHITCWEGERDSFFAESFGTVEEAVSFLESTIPMLADELAANLGVSEQID